MPLSPERRQLRARVAVLTRHHPDRPALAEARREYRVLAASEYLGRLVAEEPALTLQERGRLAAVLMSTPAAA